MTTNHDTAPEDIGEGQNLPQRKGRQAFKKVTRELGDDDLKNPAVQRLLLDDLDRLETECDELRDFRNRYHLADRKVGILEEKQKVNIAFEVMSGGLLTVGGATLAFSRNLWEHPPFGWLALVFGSILLISGIVAKVLKR